MYGKDRGFWKDRSSGEQGAATLALASVDVRYMPLPPSFNARPFTMLQYLKAFGVPVYHGKEIWQHRDLDGEIVADVDILIGQRMLRDWDGALTPTPLL